MSSLKELKEKQEGIIVKTPSNSMLASLGLRPGKKISVIAKEIFNGPLICKVDERNVALTRKMANDIMVEEGGSSIGVGYAE